MSINAISAGFVPITLPQSIPAAGAPSTGSGFANSLSEAIDSVQSLQNVAHDSAQGFMNGEPMEIHQVALDQQRAALSFDLFLQVRNKVVSAYEEVMKIQL
jgi:flagellar hook-basal body complex protein FliE